MAKSFIKNLLGVPLRLSAFVVLKNISAKAAAPLLLCERREKLDDKDTERTRVRRNKRSIVVMQIGK